MKKALPFLGVVMFSCSWQPNPPRTVSENKATIYDKTEEEPFVVKGLYYIDYLNINKQSSKELKQVHNYIQNIIHGGDCDHLQWLREAEIPIYRPEVAWQQIKCRNNGISKQISGWAYSDGYFFFFGSNAQNETFAVYILKGSTRFKIVSCTE